MMSDIAKKTLPPGSWPGSKGGRAVEEGSEASRDARSAPRSAAAPSFAKGEGGKGSTAGGDHSEEEQSHGNYTHEREKPLEEIQEQEESADGGLKKVEPQPMSNGFADDAQSEPKQSEDAQEIQGLDGDRGSKSSLSEQAKQAFERASENQPTDEARDQFLETTASQPVEPEGVEDQTVLPQDSVTSKGGPISEQPKTLDQERKQKPRMRQSLRSPMRPPSRALRSPKVRASKLPPPMTSRPLSRRVRRLRPPPKSHRSKISRYSRMLVLRRLVTSWTTRIVQWGM